MAAKPKIPSLVSSSEQEVLEGSLLTYKTPCFVVSRPSTIFTAGDRRVVWHLGNRFATQGL